MSPSEQTATLQSSLVIHKKGVDAFFRCIAINKAGSDSDVMRVLIPGKHYFHMEFGFLIY